ncbi:SDR family NAD(P)-dependent oxidoreductase [Microbacterium sp. cf332]|uniref:SDR family NAD(P)-dependent oxidoreductase n=1 Tax=Microbacterium sp. cf332 TaxID=1761804 RepID=UPI000891A202|nr:glucose 1-dehydrogenase [Microbacterium sp. cf332]SDQ53547.1 NAD(P)-dependent dehydrogenase, short-chain alcohol dehydrogenase family [Microbacterium sp. cf332]
MNNLMQDKAGLVTGAGSGIGRAGALAFARAGANVIVSDISDDSGLETVRLIEAEGGAATFVRCDVSDETQVAHLVDATVSTYGQLDFAFNNAGYNGVFAPVGEIDAATFDRVMKINLYSTFYCLKHQVTAMVDSGGGAIVNTSSAAGVVGVANNAPYNAAKHGIVGLTRNTALDYAKHGIRVNAIAPGATSSPMMSNAFDQNEGTGFRESVLAAIPMGKLSEPEDQANAAVWLCSDQARMITGVTLSVDGGYVSGR